MVVIDERESGRLAAAAAVRHEEAVKGRAGLSRRGDASSKGMGAFWMLDLSILSSFCSIVSSLSSESPILSWLESYSLSESVWSSN